MGRRLGMGIRMITNMGLHVEMDRISTAKDQRTVEEIEISRRLFWGAYVSEKLQSLYLGRPVFLHERDCHVPKVGRSSWIVNGVDRTTAEILGYLRRRRDVATISIPRRSLSRYGN